MTERHGDPMSDASDEAQRRIYAEQAAHYDALVEAEDADGTLRTMLLSRVPLHRRRVVDVGGGTGRITRWVVEEADHVDLVDRAAPMLEVARRRFEATPYRHKVAIHCADARALPLATGTVDVAVAGWVFGHFRHWMPDGWQDAVDAALDEMRRVVVPGGTLAVLETLGTGHASPREGSLLDVYFTHLEAQGFSRSWARSDYVFATPEAAAATLGPFFGAQMADRILASRWARVPECTALFVCEVR